MTPDPSEPDSAPLALSDEGRRDLRRVRHHLTVLVTVIFVTAIGFLALTLYLYQRWTAGITVTP